MEDHKFIRSDNNTGAVINTDYNGLEAYKKQKKCAKQRSAEIDKMRKDLDEIKLLLTTIIENQTK